jgi:hypothetical protein
MNPAALFGPPWATEHWNLSDWRDGANFWTKTITTRLTKQLHAVAEARPLAGAENNEFGEMRAVRLGVRGGRRGRGVSAF